MNLRKSNKNKWQNKKDNQKNMNRIKWHLNNLISKDRMINKNNNKWNRICIHNQKNKGKD